jgi:hypothetical protein
MSGDMEWGVMSGTTGMVHIEKDRNLAEMSVAEFRIYGFAAYLVKRRPASKWEPVEEPQ